jgi:mono/diheme cytochrome c family protein
MMRVLLLLALFPVVLVARPLPVHAEDADASAATFQASCARCHRDAAELADRIAADPDANAALDRFLARHHAPDEAVRRAVIDYLVRLAGG